MSTPDLNLLVTLDVLLAEGSVAGAARRLRLSPSAMSRALARLREATGDPLLVRAGRGLVPTPRAMELRDRVSQTVQDANEVLRPATAINLKQLTRTFSLRTSDGFIENFGSALLERTTREAPGVRLRFVQKTDRQSHALRDGAVDLQTGVIGPETGPEIRTQALFRDRLVGAVRGDHPGLQDPMTLESYAAGEHILVSRKGADRGVIDDALAAVGLQRNVRLVVDGFAAALAIARTSDLIASVPERHTANLRTGMHCFPLPVPTPEIVVSMLWHPRMDADPAHRWLRTCVREICAR